MSDKFASWRMPTPKQMDKLAAEAATGEAAGPAPSSPPGPADDMPEEYWDAVLRDRLRV